MSELTATYLVSLLAMVLAAASAFTLITTVNHFDRPDTRPAERKAA